MSKKPFTLKEFKNIYSKVPRLCVDLIIKDTNGIILTLRKLPDYNNQWHFPGGTVYYKETISNAIQRVARDEIGISVNVEKLINFIQFESEDKEKGFGWTVSLAFLCSPKEGLMKPNEDASEIKSFKTIPKNILKEHGDFLKIHKILK